VVYILRNGWKELPGESHYEHFLGSGIRFNNLVYIFLGSHANCMYSVQSILFLVKGSIYISRGQAQIF